MLFLEVFMKLIMSLAMAFWKPVRALAPAHEAQLINYLKATNIEVGLLLNFGRKPEFKRFVYDNKRKNISDDQLRSVAE
jgi:GxxExxY protein